MSKQRTGQHTAKIWILSKFFAGLRIQKLKQMTVYFSRQLDVAVTEKKINKNKKKYINVC